MLDENDSDHEEYSDAEDSLSFADSGTSPSKAKVPAGRILPRKNKMSLLRTRPELSFG